MIKTMKKIINRVARGIAEAFAIIGLLVCLLVAHAEGEYEPDE